MNTRNLSEPRDNRIDNDSLEGYDREFERQRGIAFTNMIRPITVVAGAGYQS